MKKGLVVAIFISIIAIVALWGGNNGPVPNGFLKVGFDYSTTEAMSTMIAQGYECVSENYEKKRMVFKGNDVLGYPYEDICIEYDDDYKVTIIKAYFSDTDNYDDIMRLLENRYGEPDSSSDIMTVWYFTKWFDKTINIDVRRYPSSGDWSLWYYKN